MEAVVWLTQEVINEEMSFGACEESGSDGLAAVALIPGDVLFYRLWCPLS